MTNPSQNWGFDPDNPMRGASVCPHCRGVTRMEIDSEMRYVCGVCGGPRVRVSGDLALSGGETESLVYGEKLRKARAGWRLGGGLSGSAGMLLALGGLAAWLFGGASVLTTAATLAVAAGLVVLALWTLSRAGAVTEQLKTAVNDAWKSVARDVVSAAGEGVSARQLKKALPLSLADSEELLAQLSVDDMLASRITETGQLVFSMHPEDVGGLRVEEADPLEAKFKALEAERAAIDEQAAQEETEALVQQQVGEHRRRDDG